MSADSDNGTGLLPLTGARYRRIMAQSTSHWNQELAMLKWALVFALISVVAGVLGFTGIAAGAAAIAKVLFFVFLALFAICLMLGLFLFKALD